MRVQGHASTPVSALKARPRSYPCSPSARQAGVALASRLPGLTQGPRQPVSPAAETAHAADSTLSGTQALQLVKRWQLVRVRG